MTRVRGFTQDDAHIFCRPDQVEEEFMKLDSKRGGTIKLDELTKVLTSRLNMSKEEAMQIFNRVDQTGDEEIHYTEFLAAALQTKLVVNRCGRS
ncbi:MAG: hypothetical protein EBZ36_15955 [Acidobacteria bacterium]|nr:hypothetical protein [Acidobacteriota bacterium]